MHLHVRDMVSQRKHGMKCWWMTVRSLEWSPLTLRTALSGEDAFEEDLLDKSNPMNRKSGFKIDMMMMMIYMIQACASKGGQEKECEVLTDKSVPWVTI